MTETLTHWKKTRNLEYLGTWALQPGEEPVLTITAAGVEKVVGADGKKEECLVIRYKGDVGPSKMIVNSTNAKAISSIADSPFLEEWPGTRIQVYSEKVSAFGSVVDAIRVKPFKVKEKKPTPNCSVCGGKIKPAYNKSTEALAKYTVEKFGAPMCAPCAEKRVSEQAAGEAGAE